MESSSGTVFVENQTGECTEAIEYEVQIADRVTCENEFNQLACIVTSDMGKTSGIREGQQGKLTIKRTARGPQHSQPLGMRVIDQFHTRRKTY